MENKDKVTEYLDTGVEYLEYVSTRLPGVTESGLLAEVIYYALKAMKDNPSLTYIEAFEAGCSEWDV